MKFRNKRLLLGFAIAAMCMFVATSRDTDKKAGAQERGTPQLAASQQDVTATVAIAQQDSATFAVTEMAAYTSDGIANVIDVGTGAVTDHPAADNNALAKSYGEQQVMVQFRQKTGTSGGEVLQV